MKMVVVPIFNSVYYELLTPNERGYAHIILESGKFARNYAEKIKYLRSKKRNLADKAQKLDEL